MNIHMRLTWAGFSYVLLIASNLPSVYAKSKLANDGLNTANSSVAKIDKKRVSVAQNKMTIVFPAEQIGKLYSLPKNWIEMRSLENLEKYFGPAKGSVLAPIGSLFSIKLSYYLIDHPAALRLPDNVVSVNGDDIGFEDTICEELSKASYLQWIALRSAEITDKGVEYLAKLENLRGLEVDRTQVCGSCIKTLTTFKNLTYVDLSQNNLKAQYFPSFALLTHLTKVRLVSVGATDQDLKWIGRMKSLESLTLKGNLKLSDAGIAFLMPLKRLNYLNIEGTAITPKGLESLLKNMNLESVTVGAKFFPLSERKRLNKLYPKTVVDYFVRDNSDANQLFAPLK